MSYRIYFEPAMLCDDKLTLVKWKSELTSEVANYRTATIKCEEFYDLQDQSESFKRTEPNYKNPYDDNSIQDNLRIWEGNKAKGLINVRRLEAKIKLTDTRFQSPIGNYVHYPRISRGF